MKNIYEDIDSINDMKFKSLMDKKRKVLTAVGKKYELKFFDYQLINDDNQVNKEYALICRFTSPITEDEFISMIYKSFNCLEKFNHHFVIALKKVSHIEDIHEARVIVGVTNVSGLFYKSGSIVNLLKNKKTPHIMRGE